MIRLIETGSDPWMRYPVAAGVLSDRPLHLTPLEAAIAAGRAEVVELLLWRTQGGDADSLARAWCLAQNVGDGDVARVVARFRAHAAEPDCSQVVRPW
jgi:hypothetical protein